MKLIFFIMMIAIYGYADTVAKRWHITKANDIISVEEKPVHYASSQLQREVAEIMNSDNSFHEVSSQKDIRTLPLAVTVPVEKESGAERLRAIQNEVEKERPVRMSTLQKRDHTPKPKAISLPQKPALSDPSAPLFRLKQFWDEHHRYHYFVVGGAALLFLLPFLFRRKRQNSISDMEISSLVTEEKLQKLLLLSEQLRGEVHQQFLIRKQNIIFNSDFTQYQKAKALLDLEREYTDLEHNYLPKLFCDDFDAFWEAESLLLARTELREVVQDFIESTLHHRRFTKLQREKIVSQMRSGYRTAHYNWSSDDIASISEGEDEKSTYLLQ